MTPNQSKGGLSQEELTGIITTAAGEVFSMMLGVEIAPVSYRCSDTAVAPIE
jgi:hypothetical protein